MDLYSLYFDKYNHFKPDGAAEEFRRAEKLLVIDDVVTLTYEKSRIQAMYLNIIDYRYSQGLSTIITTNLTKEELSMNAHKPTPGHRPHLWLVGLTASLTPLTLGSAGLFLKPDGCCRLQHRYFCWFPSKGDRQPDRSG